MALHLLDHPVAHHCIDQLRRQSTTPQFFRQLCNQVTTFLAIEATRQLPLEPVKINTPLESMEGRELAQPVVAVAILRAGMGMIERVVQILPDVSVGYVGMERDEQTAEAKPYYCKLPDLSGRLVLVVDPMLATGGSARHSLNLVQQEKPAKINFLCIVASPEGVEYLQQTHPDVDIYAGALDRELDEKKYIRPGLGDFGDRLYGTQ